VSLGGGGPVVVSSFGENESKEVMVPSSSTTHASDILVDSDAQFRGTATPNEEYEMPALEEIPGGATSKPTNALSTPNNGLSSENSTHR